MYSFVSLTTLLIFCFDAVKSPRRVVYSNWFKQVPKNNGADTIFSQVLTRPIILSWNEELFLRLVTEFVASQIFACKSIFLKRFKPSVFKVGRVNINLEFLL